MYSRSVSGKVASSSQKSIAPKNAIIAPTNQSASINKRFRYESSRSTVFLKITSPVIIATTILVQ
jgi:hypothetical protein